MKHILTYERVKNNIKKIKVGEYVLIHLNTDRYKGILNDYERYLDFFRNNIGKIIKARKIVGQPGYEYEVKFNNSPTKKDDKDNFTWFNKENDNGDFTWFADESQIIAHSKIRDEVETKMNLNKFNI